MPLRAGPDSEVYSIAVGRYDIETLVDRRESHLSTYVWGTRDGVQMIITARREGVIPGYYG